MTPANSQAARCGSLPQKIAPRTSLDVWGEEERSQRLRGHACAAPRLSGFRDDEGKHRVCGQKPAPTMTEVENEKGYNTKHPHLLA